MKILQSDEYYKLHRLPKILEGYDFRTIDEYYDLNGISPDTDENILSIANDIYFSNNWQWCGVKERSMQSHIRYINETLMSLPAENLIKKIRNTFRKDILNIYSMNAANKDIICMTFNDTTDMIDESCIGKKELLNCGKTTKMYDILEFFKYYITYISKNISGFIEVFLEPVYTECITDHLKKISNYAYHITDVKNVNSIIGHGLKPKTTKIKDDGTLTGYRYFPERIFYVGACNTKKKTIRNLKKTIQVLNKSDYAIIFVDISKHYIDFWKDMASADELENSAYSYTAIPKSFLAGVSYDVNDILY